VDVYSDPVVLPPFKLVSRGTMRPDLERLYLRQSRMPDLVALDLRAQLAGARFARDQLISLCEQFGAATVKGVMRGILDRTQRSFRQKLLTIPDGTWSEVRYVDEKLPGDRHSYRLQVNLTKTGDRLTIDNEGTDEQTDGPIGFTFTGFSGAVVGSLATSMLYEQLFALGGADRQIDYRPTPGLLSCVAYPAAVSAGVTSISTHTGAVQTALARMMASSPELKDDVIAASPDFAGWILVGEDSEGNPFGQGLMDNMAVGSGARSTHDGVDTSGPSWNPLSILLNIEQVEQWYPLIYLYRHELCDSGGAGRWRGVRDHAAARPVDAGDHGGLRHGDLHVRCRGRVRGLPVSDGPHPGSPGHGPAGVVRAEVSACVGGQPSSGGDDVPSRQVEWDAVVGW
jgi:N-methylhydantoinase B